MVWFRELEGRWAYGTVVPAPRTFLMNVDTGEVTFDDHVAGAPQSSLSVGEKDALEAQVRQALAFPVAEVRIGQYRCHTCGRWVAADSNQWSHGLCLSCSMDRDSDRWG